MNLNFVKILLSSFLLILYASFIYFFNAKIILYDVNNSEKLCLLEYISINPDFQAAKIKFLNHGKSDLSANLKSFFSKFICYFQRIFFINNKTQQLNFYDTLVNKLIFKDYKIIFPFHNFY